MAATRSGSSSETHAPFVVIAEDDDDIREGLAEILARDGFRVRAVSDGELLAEVLLGCSRAHDLPDVVVTDHRMPVRSGLDVLESIVDAGWTVQVIMLTAFGEEIRRFAEAKGALVVFDKPFDLDELRTGVHWAIDWSRHELWAAQRRKAAR